MLNKKFRGMSSVVGSVVVATLSVVACSDSFSGGGDCKSTRTCSEVAGSGGSGDGAEGGGGALGGSADAVAGAGDATTAGAAVAAGAAGAAGAASGCETDQECSNGVAEDGVELCENGACLPGNPPPTVVSVTPDDDASGVEPDAEIVIEFSEPLDPATVTNETVQVLDGTTPVPGKLSYLDGKVTFTPDAPLALLAPYTISVTSGVKDADGAALLEEFSSTFAVRDGAWKTIDAVKDKVVALSDTLPITSTGDVLLAWSGSGGFNCPVSAHWYLRGEATAPTKTFQIQAQTECNGVSAGGNAAGVVALVWNEPDAFNGSDITQFRAGAWQPMPTLVSKNFSSYHYTLAVSPAGAVTFFEHSTESKAWTSSASGEWPADGNVLGSYSDQSRTSFEFDAKGNGLALWRGRDRTTKIERIVASRFTSASGKWAAGVDLPGSVAANASVSSMRGVPVVAMDAAGDAMALWVDASVRSELKASRFVQSSGWAEPELVSGGLLVEPLQEPPALVFDGKQFVAAWTAEESGKPAAYTARYDLKTGWSTYDKQQQTAGDGTSAKRMPRLTSDRRGNLLLVFAEGGGPTFSFVYQRYTAGAWGPILTLPDGLITDKYFANGEFTPMSMNASGLAALAWADHDASNYISAIHLASFF